ncbi:pol protein [Cucumis melo var. makuwa]|uniref:Pol protein n=1 Tax=Cucumis melo var. makuwa TaxID=1194695 RepID=A0A5A7SY69_CUCMM|nr:pol protein [Cucumis melo var. makuwa]TYK19709.1 pol protein [Cucumis melo var. makuwa]
MIVRFCMDYDCEILYHPGKVNVVVDVLSRKLAQLSVQPTLRQRMIIAQQKDPYLVEKRRMAEAGQDEEFSIASDDGLMFERRLSVPADGQGTKTEASRFVATLEYARAHEVSSFHLSKIHLHCHSGKDFSLHWAQGSWDSYLHSMKLSYNNSYQATISLALFEALYGRCCRSSICWVEVGEQRMLGSKFFHITNAAIQKIRAPSMKGVLRFEKKGKLCPCFVEPFEILERIGPVAYHLTLPPAFSTVHNVFHVYMQTRHM